MQAQRALNADASVKVIVASKTEEHSANFGDVVFTIDDIDEDLKHVVRRGLNAAAAAGYKVVSMPAMRFGVMRDIGGTPQQKIEAIATAIKEHEHEDGPTLDSVAIVVFNDPDLALQLRVALSDHQD